MFSLACWGWSIVTLQDAANSHRPVHRFISVWTTSDWGALSSSTSHLTFPPNPFSNPHLLITSSYLRVPPNLHSSLCRLPPPSLSGHLIKGAPSNEITPLGLIAWLIDRHTAGRGLRPSKSPGIFFFFFSRLIEITGMDGNILGDLVPCPSSAAVLDMFPYPHCRGQRSNSRMQKAKKKKKIITTHIQKQYI